MKLSDGYWRVRQGFSASWARQTISAEPIDAGLRVRAAANLSYGDRGATLGGPLFTITLSAPAEGIIKVVEEHFRGVPDRGPHFRLKTDPNAAFEISQGGDGITCRSGILEAVVSNPGEVFSMDFRANGKSLTGTAYKGFGVYEDQRARYAQLPPQDHMDYDEGCGVRHNYVREQLRLAPDEKVYGFGERFGHFVKNGQTVEMWNSDAGTSSDSAYKSIPFYWTSKGYGIFVNHPEDVSFEVGSESVGKIQFSTRGERLEYYVIAGPEPKDVLRRYTALTGRAPTFPHGHTDCGLPRLSLRITMTEQLPDSWMACAKEGFRFPCSTTIATGSGHTIGAISSGTERCSMIRRERSPNIIEKA